MNQIEPMNQTVYCGLCLTPLRVLATRELVMIKTQDTGAVRATYVLKANLAAPAVVTSSKPAWNDRTALVGDQ
eukprot:6171542-Amphidinium_carterae.1